jgi:hypothetical protein
LRSSNGMFFMLTLSIVMVQRALHWETQNKLQKPRNHGREMSFEHTHTHTHIYIYIANYYYNQEERKEEGKKINIKIPQNCSFWNMIEKSQHIHFLVHGHSSRSTFGSHELGGQKTLKGAFFHKFWPWKISIWHGTTGSQAKPTPTTWKLIVDQS